MKAENAQGRRIKDIKGHFIVEDDRSKYEVRPSKRRSSRRAYTVPVVCCRFGKCCTNHLDHFTKNFPCYFEWRIPAWVLGAVGQMERQWVKSRSPLLTLPQVTVARAQGGITPGPEEGELGADFTSLGTQRPGLRAILQFSRVQS